MNMKTITSAELLDILPHRYPFLMIDRVLDYDENTLTAIKNFTVNEPYVQGHFPGNHIMPGVMLIEAMAQASTVLAFKYLQNNDLLHEFIQGGILFTAADQIRFKKVLKCILSLTFIKITKVCLDSQTLALQWPIL